MEPDTHPGQREAAEARRRASEDAIGDIRALRDSFASQAKRPGAPVAYLQERVRLCQVMMAALGDER